MKKIEVLISTDSVDREERGEFFRDLFAPVTTITPLNFNEFEGGFRVRSVADLSFVNLKSEAYAYERSKLLIARADFDAYILMLILSGTRYHNSDTGPVVLEVGDIMFGDMTKMMSGMSTAVNALHMYIPRRALERLTGGDRALSKVVHNVVFKANHPIVKLLRDYMIGAFDVALELKHEEEDATVEALGVLIVALLKGTDFTLSDSSLEGELNRVLKHRITQFIDINLNNPKLSIELLMRQFKVSRSHLYRAFAEDGGIVKAIRERRLDMAYRDLINATSPRKTEDIAYKWGFKSAEQLNRAFRSRFGFDVKEIQPNSKLLIPDLDASNSVGEYFFSLDNFNKR